MDSNKTTLTDTLARVFGTSPMLLLPGAFNGLMARSMQFEARQPIARGFRVAGPGQSMPRPAQNWDGECSMLGMTIQDGVAEIPVYGYIGNKLDPLAKWYFDATDLQDVGRELDIAEATPGVHSILFTFDTPGGSSAGVPEMGDRIAAASKPTAAWIDGLCASAGYWMASQCSPIGSTRASDTGSIGVYTAFRDYSKLFADAGVTVQVFASGKYKGMGVLGTSLTEDQAAYIQSDVDELATEFKRVVNVGRSGAVPEENMQGQTLPAVRALTGGLIDVIVPTKAAFIQGARLR